MNLTAAVCNKLADQLERVTPSEFDFHVWDKCIIGHGMKMGLFPQLSFSDGGGILIYTDPDGDKYRVIEPSSLAVALGTTYQRAKMFYDFDGEPDRHDRVRIAIARMRDLANELTAEFGDAPTDAGVVPCDRDGDGFAPRD